MIINGIGYFHWSDLRDAPHLKVKIIDNITGKKIDKVIEANDITGEYRKYSINEYGKCFLSQDRSEVVSESHVGNISFDLEYK